MNNYKIGIIELGYVGLPIMKVFNEKFDTKGYDINKDKINQYKNGNDITGEIGDDSILELKENLYFDEKAMEDRNVFIITVPTPITEDKIPL